MPSAEAEEKKSQGNARFKARDYDGAIALYTEAVEMEPGWHVYYSNRCAAYSGKGDFASAEEDAKRCVAIKRDFIKGWFRLASAQKAQGKFVESLKTCEDALRIEASHPDIMRLREEVTPLAARQERERRSGMSRLEVLKEEGNDAFRAAQFEKAIGIYSEAVEEIGTTSLGDLDDSTRAVAIKVYNNRAACYQQLSNFSAVISDTTIVLEVEPRNLKALLRRGLAFEGLERYRSALQDIRAVLAIDPTVDIANRAQHRLGSAVRALKAAKARETERK